MQHVPRRKVTIVAEALLEDRIVRELRGLGARGFTIADVRGQEAAKRALCVAAAGPSGGLLSMSNYGRTTVDLAAPGGMIQSTFPNGSYGILSGTSMATPHVTGAVALCASLGTTSASAIRDDILATTTATACNCPTTTATACR